MPKRPGPILNSGGAQAALGAMLTGVAMHWALADTHHVVGLTQDPELYRKRIEEFLTQALPTPQVICEK